MGVIWVRGWIWWAGRRRRRDRLWVRVAAEGVIAMGLLVSGAAVAHLAGAPAPFGPSWLATVAAAPTPPATPVRVDVITAAGGRAILISSGGKAVLIDGGAGPTGEAVVAALKRLGLTSLVAAFMTRGNTSGAAGLIAVMDAVPLGRLYDLAPGNTCPAHQGVLADARAHHVPVRGAERGRALVVGAARIEVLWPPAQLGGGELPKDPGLVALEDGQVRMVFADGLTAGELPAIARLGRDVRAQVLELPGGGSAPTLPTELLAAVRPRVVLLEPTSSGVTPQVLAELASAHILGVEVSRTSDLALETDGHGITLAMAAGQAGAVPSAADAPPPESGACA